MKQERSYWKEKYEGIINTILNANGYLLLGLCGVIALFSGGIILSFYDLFWIGYTLTISSIFLLVIVFMVYENYEDWKKTIKEKGK